MQALVPTYLAGPGSGARSAAVSGSTTGSSAFLLHPTESKISNPQANARFMTRRV
jgi:hypothetical protein